MGELPPDAEDNRESADRSYGAYEMRFLRQVKERYVSAVADLEFVDRLIGNSVNPCEPHLREDLFSDVSQQPQGSRADTLALTGLGQGLRA